MSKNPRSFLLDVLLCRIMVANMVRAVQQGNEELATAMLWLTAYTFLLRLPSEVRGYCVLRIVCMLVLLNRRYVCAKGRRATPH